MEITRGKLKKIIREEVDRMAYAEDATVGKEMAENLIQEFKNLPLNDQRVFLSRFVKFLNQENA
jgi:hypothetical protein